MGAGEASNRFVVTDNALVIVEETVTDRDLGMAPEVSCVLEPRPSPDLPQIFCLLPES